MRNPHLGSVRAKKTSSFVRAPRRRIAAATSGRPPETAQSARKSSSVALGLKAESTARSTSGGQGRRSMRSAAGKRSVTGTGAATRSFQAGTVLRGGSCGSRTTVSVRTRKIPGARPSPSARMLRSERSQTARSRPIAPGQHFSAASAPSRRLATGREDARACAAAVAKASSQKAAHSSSPAFPIGRVTAPDPSASSPVGTPTASESDARQCVRSTSRKWFRLTKKNATAPFSFKVSKTNFVFPIRLMPRTTATAEPPPSPPPAAARAHRAVRRAASAVRPTKGLSRTRGRVVRRPEPHGRSGGAEAHHRPLDA